MGRSSHVMSAFVCEFNEHKDSTHATILDPSEKIVNQTIMNNERMLSYLSRVMSMLNGFTPKTCF